MDATSTLQNTEWLMRRCGISRQRAYQLVRENIVPCVKLGRQVKFDPEQVERWIAKGGQPLAGGWKRDPEA